MTQTKNIKLLLPKINLNAVDNTALKQMLKFGGALIKLPDEIYQNLQEIHTVSTIFFNQDLKKKQFEVFGIDNKEGFLDQSATGYAIERFINRGSQPNDPIMSKLDSNIRQVRQYYEQELAPSLLKAILDYIKIPQQNYETMLKDPDVTLSIIHYPKKPEEELRIKPHKDAVLITILWAPEPGLDICIDGEWQKITCEQGYAIAQTGDGLNLWTNGKTKPLEHRVIVPRNTQRISIASFFGLNNALPFNDLITNKSIAHTFGEYVNEHIRNTYTMQNK